MATVAQHLELVVATDAHEGPVYVDDEDALYFTSLPQPGPGGPVVDIRRVLLGGAEPRVETVRADANAANGMTLDGLGRLVICEQGSLSRPARITRMDRRTRAVETVVDGWAGLPLNSPNDVVVRRDGTIWFTDPAYGRLQGFRPAPRAGDHVYRHDPRTGHTSVVADGFVKPNGLAFSPDERTLYVTDSGANQEPGSFHPELPHHVIAFDVRDGRRLAGERIFEVTTAGIPDGIKTDAEGRVYVSAATGVQIFDPSGDPLGEIALPGAVNFCFGGRGRTVLFITTDTAVWAAELDRKGAWA